MTRRLNKKDENHSPPTKGVVRWLMDRGWVPRGGKLSLNGTHPVRLRRPPLRRRGFFEVPHVSARA
jgi:hypothetical protein